MKTNILSKYYVDIAHNTMMLAGGILSSKCAYSIYTGITHDIAMGFFKSQGEIILAKTFACFAIGMSGAFLTLSVMLLIQTITRMYKEVTEKRNEGFFSRNFPFIANKI